MLLQTSVAQNLGCLATCLGVVHVCPPPYLTHPLHYPLLTSAPLSPSPHGRHRFTPVPVPVTQTIHGMRSFRPPQHLCQISPGICASLKAAVLRDDRHLLRRFVPRCVYMHPLCQLVSLLSSPQYCWGASSWIMGAVEHDLSLREQDEHVCVCVCPERRSSVCVCACVYRVTFSLHADCTFIMRCGTLQTRLLWWLRWSYA